MFFAIEGLDRAGKSGVIETTKQVVNGDYVVIQFPDRSTESGKILDAYLKRKKNNLSNKEVHELFVRNIREKEDYITLCLLRGINVICDRHICSTLAYSVGALGLDIDWCIETIKDIPWPDVILFVEVDPNVASKRNKYGDERFEVLKTQCKVLDAYNTIFKHPIVSSTHIVSVKIQSE